MENKKLTKDELNLLLFIKEHQNGISQTEIKSHLKEIGKITSEYEVSYFETLLRFRYLKYQSSKNNFVISAEGELYLEEVNSNLKEEQLKQRTLELSEEASKNSKIANIISGISLFLSLVALLISLLKE